MNVIGIKLLIIDMQTVWIYVRNKFGIIFQSDLCLSNILSLWNVLFKVHFLLHGDITFYCDITNHNYMWIDKALPLGSCWITCSSI